MRSAVVLLAAIGCTSGPIQDYGTGDGGSNPDATVIEPGTLDDEFDDPNTRSAWTLLDDSLHQVLDISVTTPGKLTIVPKASSAWYEDGKGPFLFKTIRGNFSAKTSVVAGNVADPDAPPTSDFNSAGFVARDPASRPGGNENWLMFNTGFQDGRIGTEGKTTVDSRSTLYVIDGAHRAELLLCRVGSRFLMLRKLEGESSFTEMHRFDRPDLPTELQVGLVANAYTGVPTLHATFDWVRFETIETEADCE